MEHHHYSRKKCVVHEETCEAVELALDALAHALDQHHGLKVVDVVFKWFWDGNLGAMQAISIFVPTANGHLCLEHATRNTEKRYSGGFKKLTKNFTEFNAFLTPQVFNIAVNLF